MKYWKTNSLTKSDHIVIHIINEPYIIRIYTVIVPINARKYTEITLFFLLVKLH